MKYDTCLFDLDGTLTDSAPGILNAVRHALEKVGAPVPDSDALRQFIGPPLVDSFMRLCGFSKPAAEQALLDYREYFTTGGMFENSVYPGIVVMLEKLNAAGIRCLLCTSKPEPFARQILDHFNLTRHFAALHGATLDESRNRKSDVISWALSHTSDPGRCVMIGDRADDVLGAVVNHLDAIAVTWGYGTEDEHRAAIYRAPSPVALADFILS